MKHALARRLDKVFSNTIIDRVLSRYGQRVYFPQGIVAQSQEAGTLAHFANATAGVALEKKHYMTHRVFDEFSKIVSTDGMVGYAPTAGDPALRQAWWDEVVRKNPPLASLVCSLPVITAGLTHALAVAADLFLDSEDTIIVPSPCWDNYEQILGVRHGGVVIHPPLFDSNLRFTSQALGESICSAKTKKVFIVLNFPNNPSGYTPLQGQMEDLRDCLVACAEAGKELVAVIDDAYFGLFHEETIYPYSLFSLLAHAHENILAIKCDAATKEALVWGFRIGFITYAAKGLKEAHYDALVQKTMGVIRSSVSSCSRIGQSLLLAAMQQAQYREDITHVTTEMTRRYRVVQEAIKQQKSTPVLQPLPFNSGYFCAFRCKGNAEDLRRDLLEKHRIGTVALGGDLLRVAYASVDAELLPAVIERVYRSAKTLWK